MAKVYKDLREFLKTLEEEGQLIRVKDEVDPEPDIGAAGRACANMDKKPAVLFEKVKGYKYSVVTNVHGSWANHALMMGMPKDTPVKEQFFELNRRWDKFPVPPVIVPREKALCKENTISENINLFEILPLYRINDQDGGFFLSKACVVTGDPAEPDNLDKQNVGTYRIQVKDIDRIGIQALPFHDIAIQLAKAEEVNEPLPVAIALWQALLSTMTRTNTNSSARCRTVFLLKSLKPILLSICMFLLMLRLSLKAISFLAFVPAKVRSANSRALIPVPETSARSRSLISHIVPIRYLKTCIWVCPGLRSII